MRRSTPGSGSLGTTTPPADRLRICLSGGLPHPGGEWADTAARPLEDQLAEIVPEVGVHHGETADASVWLTWRKHSRSAGVGKPRSVGLRPHTQRHTACATSKHSTRRGSVQRTSSSTSAHSGFMQRVCRPGRPEEAEAWSAWAESHVQRLKPLNVSPLLPDIPEPRTEDLHPFMHG
jgi:hypothetical protein